MNCDDEQPENGPNLLCDCGNSFKVKPSLKGGIASCPRCGHPVNVPGTDFMFYFLVFLGFVFVVGISSLLYCANPTVGLITMVIGLVVLVIVCFAS
jgi:hypothetical protein